MRRLIIIGANDLGRSVAETAKALGKYEDIFFLDDYSQEEDVKSCCADFVTMSTEDTDFYPAFMDNDRRMNWFHRLMEFGCNIPAIIHPTAFIDPTATIILGTLIFAHAVVRENSLIKAGTIIDEGAVVENNCIIDEGVLINPGAVIKKENHIPAFFKVDGGQVIEESTY